jgi:uncharacterized protein YggE
LAAAVGLAASAGATGCSKTTIQATSPVAMAVEGISVMGQGEARGKPDVARTRLGVEARAPTAKQATDRVSQQMDTVLRVLRDRGVKEADMRTTEYRVNFVHDAEPRPWDPPRPPEPPPSPRAGPRAKPRVLPTEPPEMAPPAPEPPGSRGFYMAANSVEVTLRNVEDVGATLAAALEAGANSVDQLWFAIDDPSALEQEARTEAMNQAKRSAEHLAQLSGVELGHVMSVTERGGATPMPMSAPGVRLAAEAASLSVPVAPGELTITQTVQVVYAIER